MSVDLLRKTDAGTPKMKEKCIHPTRNEAQSKILRSLNATFKKQTTFKEKEIDSPKENLLL